MNNARLVMKWEYEYDKESTWFNEDSGEERYELIEGAAYPLPHEPSKSIEIRAVTTAGERTTAEVTVDHRTVTVVSDGEPVTAHADNSYSVCGDSVHESWILQLSIEQ